MITYLKRRFSSGDLQGELADKREQEGLPSFLRFTSTFTGPSSGTVGSDAPDPQLGQARPSDNQQQSTAGYKQTMFSTGGGGRASYTSAPTSPSRSMSFSSNPMSSFTGQISSTIMRGISQATQGISSARGGAGGVGGGSGRQKILLVIDDSQVDWSKYFKGRKISPDWDIRVEQAQFSEMSMTAYSEQGCVVSIYPLHEKRRTKPIRSFKPDFVLLRQHATDVGHDWQNLLTGLMFGATPCLNTLHAVCNMKNRPWLFAHLLLIRNRLGKDNFPVISQSYHTGSEEMSTQPNFPTVVKLGLGHRGEGKIRIDDASTFQDVTGMVSLMSSCVTMEPLIDTKCDLHLQKIGPSYKAFVRKSMSGNWKSNTGASMLERIPMNDKFKQWIDEVARMFGGLDICSVEALQSKTDDYFIYDVNGSDMTLLGESQEEDRRAISDLVIQRMTTLASQQTTISNTPSLQGIQNANLQSANFRQQSPMTKPQNSSTLHQPPTPIGQSSLPATPSAAYAKRPSTGEQTPQMQQQPMMSPPTAQQYRQQPPQQPPPSVRQQPPTIHPPAMQSPPSTSYGAGAGTSGGQINLPPTSSAATTTYRPNQPPSATYSGAGGPSPITSSSANQNWTSFSTGQSRESSVVSPTSSTSSNPHTGHYDPFQASSTSSYGATGTGGSHQYHQPQSTGQSSTFGRGPSGGIDAYSRPLEVSTASAQSYSQPSSSSTSSMGHTSYIDGVGTGSIAGTPGGRPYVPPRETSLKQAEQGTDEVDDTMKNLRKTFAGLFGDM